MAIDHERLNEHRVTTTISGVYLDVWSSVLKKRGFPRDLNEYLVRFSEIDTEYEIHLIRPMKKPILGGGNGVIKIDKKSREITPRIQLPSATLALSRSF